MGQYLLSVHSVEGAPRPDRTPEEMHQSMAGISVLEDEMRESGAFVFSARLTDPGDAKVVRGALSMTDGPFAEAKEQIAGFYIISADTEDDALAWAARVVDCISSPIEVRPFFDSRAN